MPLARFFADTGAGKRPDRETVAAWRDSLTAKGYTPFHRQCAAGPLSMTTRNP